MIRPGGPVVRVIGGGAILAAMVAFVAVRGGPMARAALLLDPAGVLAAIGLCLAHRAINAAGWGIVLASLGTPVRIVPAARIWLAAEACRWIPGSVWAFGSRALLASARGIPARVASVSVVLELLATLAAWGMVAGLGAGTLPIAPGLSAGVGAGWPAAGAFGLAALVVAGVARPRGAPRGRGADRLAALLAVRPRAAWVGVAFLFYAGMAVFNGLILVVVLRALDGAGPVPVRSVVAANALAWLTGFLAVVAPGGIVVREACLASLLSAWIPPEEALVVALAWRLVQVVAEIVTFAAVASTGIPSDLLRSPAAPAAERGGGGRSDGLVQATAVSDGSTQAVHQATTRKPTAS